MTARTASREPVVLAWLIGLAPLLVLVLTWDPEGASSALAARLREHALPILAVEGLIVGIAVIAGLVPWLRQTPRFIVIAFFVWLLAALGSSVFVAGTSRSISMTGIWVLHGAFSASVAFLSSCERRMPDHLLNSLQVGFVIYALAIAYFALQASGQINWVTDIPGLGNLRRVAVYATLVAGISIGLAARSFGWMPIFTAALALFTAFWTGSRATAPAVLGAAILTAIIFPKSRNWRMMSCVVIAAVTGFLLALAFPVQAGVGNDAFRAIANTDDNGRLRIWMLSLEAISRSPLVGYGEGETAWVLPDNPLTPEDFQGHPHNLFLQWMMAWGILGTIPLLIIGGWITKSLYRAGREPATLPFVIGAGALTVHAMVDGALYDVAPVFLFAACVGAACAAGPRPAHPK